MPRHDIPKEVQERIKQEKMALRGWIATTSIIAILIFLFLILG